MVSLTAMRPLNKVFKKKKYLGRVVPWCLGETNQAPNLTKALRKAIVRRSKLQKKKKKKFQSNNIYILYLKSREILVVNFTQNKERTIIMMLH